MQAQRSHMRTSVNVKLTRNIKILGIDMKYGNDIELGCLLSIFIDRAMKVRQN